VKRLVGARKKGNIGAHTRVRRDSKANGRLSANGEACPGVKRPVWNAEKPAYDFGKKGKSNGGGKKQQNYPQHESAEQGRREKRKGGLGSKRGKILKNK